MKRASATVTIAGLIMVTACQRSTTIIPAPRDSGVELARVAVLEALSQQGYRYSTNIALSPRLAEFGGAPGVEVNDADAEWIAALARSLDARIAPVDEVVVCEERTCRMQGSAAHVTVSVIQPQGADSAITVTVQAAARPGRGIFYETTELLMRRVNGVWQVAARKQLGIT